MKALSRATALKLAAALSFLVGAFNVISSVPFITRGAEAVDSVAGVDTPPFFILILGLILGIVAMVAAYGTWKQRRWGIILTIIVNTVGGISALPGLVIPVPFSPLWWSAVVGVILSILIVVLCLWRGPKPVVAQV
ncbi:MAG: hypothetical protein U0768_20395 [Anaerolineae bacterium]